MDENENKRITETSIGGTVYVVESRICETAKENVYSKIKRLITANTKTLLKLSDSSNISLKSNSTSSN